MPVWRLQTAMYGDSGLDRDAFVITPHFNDQGVGTDPQGLADDWAEAVDSWIPVGSNRQIKVTAYDAQGSAPVYPQGEAIRNEGIFPASGVPRELALCLSFYGSRNVPRQRGRLYIPAATIASSADLGVRPATAIQEAVSYLVAKLTALGGADVDWCVYSQTTKTPHSVTNWWVDDEWDIIRSRGLRPSSRLAGTTSEG